MTCLRRVLLPLRSACLAVVLATCPQTRAQTEATLPAAAEKTPAALENIVVVGARRDTRVAELPYAVSLLDSEALERKLLPNLGEALTQLPGVSLQKSANGQGSPFLRGFTGYRTLTMIDGVRYNNSVYRDGPNEYFSLIDFNVVDRVEVLGGPASVLFGSDAIGGTLNLKTHASAYEQEDRGRAFIRGRQRVAFATASNSRQTRTEIDTGYGRHWGLRLGYSLKHFGNINTAGLGKQHHTAYGEKAWDARLDANLSDQWRVSMAYQHLAQDDVWRTFATRFAQPYAGTAVGSDRQRLKDLSRHLGYVRLEGNYPYRYVDNIKLTLSHQGWNEDGDRIRVDARRLLEVFESTMIGADLEIRSNFHGIDLVYGLDAYRDKVDSGRRDFNPDGTLERVRIQGPVGDDSRFRQLGAYAEASVEPIERVALNFGSRYTQVSANVGRFEDPLTTLPARFTDQWSEVVSSVRLSYFPGLDRTTMLMAGLSQSFRAPNIADLSRFGASRSNEIEVAANALEPEKFLTAEVGLRSTRGPLSFSAVAYHTRMREFITSTPTGRIINELTEVSKRNSARGRVRGLEFSVDRYWTNGLSLWANLTWIEGELDRPSATGGARTVREPLTRIMPLTAHFGLRWASDDDRFWAAIDTTAAGRASRLSAGDRADSQRIPPGGTPGYEIVNISLGARLNRYFELSAKVANLSDATYRTHGSGTNEAGISADVALTATF